MKPPSISTVGIACKPQSSGRLRVLDDLLSWCRVKGFRPLLDPVALSLAGSKEHECRERSALPVESDLIVVLGGDGTLLSVARHLGDSPAPILGVNLGSLGFLTEIPAEEMLQTLDSYLDGAAATQSRMMLDASLERGSSVMGSWRCLNDAVITKAALARMIEVRLEVGGQWLTDMRADGIILSTPTGATAYNLSAGGPILMPAISGIILTPLCPHTLTMRPIILDGSEAVTVALLRGEEVFFTADGQEGIKVQAGDRLRAEPSSRSVTLITSPRRDYFALLREKLGWGAKTGARWQTPPEGPPRP